MAFTPSVIRTFLPVQSSWGFWKKPIRLSFTAAPYSALHLLPPDEQRDLYDRFVFEAGRAATGFRLFTEPIETENRRDT
jgi:hypothetical protein